MPNKHQRTLIFNKLGYKPSDEQDAVHDCSARIRQVAGGERAGKSKLSAMDLMGRFYEGQLYWLVAADYERTRAEFDYICDAFEKLKWRYEATKQVDPGEILAEGGFRFVTKSAKDPRKLAVEAPDGILVCEASQIDWETYLRLRGRLAEKRGWMLMSGTFESCLTADAEVLTGRGLLPINEIISGDTIIGLNGQAVVSNTWVIGEKPTVHLELTKGFSLSGTLDHKVITRKPDGSIVWEELDKVSNKDLVAIRYGTHLFGAEKLDIDDAYLVGFYIAEGCMSSTDYRTIITNGDQEINEWLISKYKFHRKDKVHLAYYKKDLRDKLISWGIKPELKATTKEVPVKILQSSKETQVSFLQALFDGDGSVTSSRIVYYTSSKKLAKQVQIMLLNLGIVSCLTKRKCKLNGKVFPSFTLAIANPEEFTSSIGFRIKEKQAKAQRTKNPRFFRNQANAGNYFLDYPIVWCRLRDKTYSNEIVYDISIPSGHAFWANGFIAHNSLGWYVDMWQLGQLPTHEFASFSLPTWSNLAVFPGGKNDPEILALKRDYSEEWFAERFGGVPSPPKGLVFHEFRVPIHVRRGQPYEYQGGLPVYLWVDNGFSHAYAVEVVQVKDDQIIIVDEIYEKGLVTSDIITIAKQKIWWKDVVGGAIDIAALQHQSMPAVAEIWQKEGNINLRYNKVRIIDGIERMKSFLKVNPLTGQPGMVINFRCKGLISELGGCPNPIDGATRVYKWRISKDGLLAGETPEDKNNDACKAVAYGLVDLKGYASSPSRQPIIKFF